MYRLFLTNYLLLFLLLCGYSKASAQIYLAPTVEATANFEEGAFLGVGLGIRKGSFEVLPMMLLGSGKGAKLEARWYHKINSGRRLLPYFTFQQFVFRTVNTCINNSCPYWMYQAMPGAGMAYRTWKHLYLYGSVASGVKKRQFEELRTDFMVTIGLRYGF